MAKLEDKLQDLKADGYGTNSDNFSIDGELMVTITLNEYRTLIAERATKKTDIDAANKDRYQRENDIKNVRTENDALRAELYTLKNKIEKLRNAAAEKEET